jgi:hypothetical protein|tara:strand:- start:143 stop:1291 length:1149 start_codon:yes stop_codon:yes gene_type:complete
MDIITKYLNNIAYKFPKGYPDMNDSKDKAMLNEIINNIIKEEEIKSLDDLKVDVVLDPKQEEDEIEDKKDDLQNLLKTVTDKKSKDKISLFIKNLEYIDKVNHYLDKKNFDDIEEILVKAFIDRNNQYKIFYEYLPKMINYSNLPSDGNLIKIMGKYGFDEKFLSDLLKRDYQAGGKGVGPGELFLVTLLKDTYKGGKGDVQIKAKDETGVIVAGGKEIEIKATGAQLSVFSRSDTFSNNFYKWLKKYNETYWGKFSEGRVRVPYRLENLINSLSSDESSKFLKDFIPYFSKIYSERVNIKPALDKAINNNKFDGSIFEIQMGKILASAYIAKENIEGFLFLDKNSGNFDTFSSNEVIDNIGDGKLEISAYSDMSPRLRLKK